MNNIKEADMYRILNPYKVKLHLKFDNRPFIVNVGMNNLPRFIVEKMFTHRWMKQYTKTKSINEVYFGLI